MLTKSFFEEALLISEDFESGVTLDEAELLYTTAAKLKGDGVIVEIGSWCGKSITIIATGALKNGFNNKIYSIDPFLTSKDEPNGKYETFIQNLKKNNLDDKITHLKEKSQIAGQNFNENIEFIFIDGFHTYDAVKKDFDLFYPKIVEGGYIAIHDVAYYKGPTDLIMKLIHNDTFKIIDFKYTTVLAQKVSLLTEEEKENNKKYAEIINSSYRCQTLLV